MNNLLLLPILIPLLTGVLLIFVNRYITATRVISLVSFTATLVSAIVLFQQVKNKGIQTLNISNWDAPFGITLVSDYLSVMLIITTSIIALLCCWYSFYSIGAEREKFYYYSVLQFLIVGVNGAFTTGDLFNLFVFFEVMLMSSYVLLVLGGTKVQLRASVKYILVNVISSSLFVVAVAYLYSVVGTLNMAHIAERLSSHGQEGIVTVIAVLFLIVFGLKGAIFPLYVWLPGSYAAPPIPVLAIFGALLTKVGIYAIMRTYTLMFRFDQEYTHQLLAILAILTIVVGVIGAIAYWDVKKIIIYNIIVAVGVILFGVSIATTTALTGAIFYLIHDMVIKAALFLLVGVMVTISGTSNLRKMSGLMNDYPLLAWTYFVAALSLAGIPPLSGFVGKLLIIQGGFEANQFAGAAVVLLSSLLVLFSVMKIFINGFWGIQRPHVEVDRSSYRSLLVAPVILVVISIFLGLSAEWFYPYMLEAAQNLVDPSTYIEAVLKE